MCKVMEELIDNERKKIALRMLEDGNLTLEMVATYTGLTLERVKDLSQFQSI